MIGSILSLFIGWFSYLNKSLTASGVLGAVILGTIYFGLGSPKWYVILLFFYITSTVLSKRKKQFKEKLEKDFEKTGNRDFFQTMANGGVGGFLIILTNFIPKYDFDLYMLFLGIMATVTADTWGTEVGILSKEKPIHIISRKRVEPGQSGGITLIGTLMSLLGSFLIALIGIVLLEVTIHWIHSYQNIILLIVIVTISGFVGGLFDSLIGAKCQRMNYCNVCKKIVESNSHCNQSTSFLKGNSWLNNDLVNLFSSILGGIMTFILTYLFIMIK